jgi:Rod binding domain-containing protein
MNIDQTLPIQNMASLNAVPGLSDKAQADGEKIKEFAQGFEAVFISNLLDQMSASVDSLNEDKDGAAKQIDGIFRMQLAQNLSENGSLGLAKSIEQYVSHSMTQDQAVEETEGLVL